MALTLNNAEVAAAFTTNRDTDVEILVPGFYHGMLSNISLAAAQRLQAIGDTNLKPIPAPEATTKAKEGK